MVEWHVHHQAACEDSDASGHGETIGNLVEGLHIEHRRETAVIARRNIAFVQGGVFHHVVIKHREESQEMRGVIDRSVVKGDEVLVGRAAAYAESRRAFRGGLNARKQLYCLDDIDLAHQCRDLTDFYHLELLYAHGELTHVGVFLLTCDDDVVEHLCLGFHVYIQSFA